MGDASDAVYLLRWEGGKAGEASANGPTKIKTLDGGEVVSKTAYQNGQYRVVIKRPLAGKGEGRPPFHPATSVSVAVEARGGGGGGRDGAEVVGAAVCFSAAAAPPAQPPFCCSSDRGAPHAGGDGPRRARGRPWPDAIVTAMNRRGSRPEITVAVLRHPFRR